jgi:hypothetical protein
MDTIKTLSAVRVAIGGGAWLTPGVAGKAFGLDPAGNPQLSYMARLFGVRDVVLGVGLLTADRRSRARWLKYGVACDLADATSSAISAKEGGLPKLAAVLTGATALGAAGLGIAALTGR